jgi:hypothetical protein
MPLGRTAHERSGRPPDSAKEVRLSSRHVELSPWAGQSFRPGQVRSAPYISGRLLSSHKIGLS